MKKSGGKTMSSKQTRRMRRQFLKHHAVLLGILDKNLQSRFNPPLRFWRNCTSTIPTA